jgi:hypothetical protein
MEPVPCRIMWIRPISGIIFCPLAAVTAVLELEVIPTVLSRSGFDVRLYLNDHAPPHVHVIRHSGEARIGIVPVMILGVHSLSRREAAKAKELVEEEMEFLLHKWVELHGPTIISN